MDYWITHLCVLTKVATKFQKFNFRFITGTVKSFRAWGKGKRSFSFLSLLTGIHWKSGMYWEIQIQIQTNIKLHL